MMDPTGLALLKVPSGAAEAWVEVECDCGHGGAHNNQYRLLDGDIVLMTRMDIDEVVWEWQVLMQPEGQVARGYGHTPDECHLQAEMSAKALITDREAFLANHPETAPTVH